MDSGEGGSRSGSDAAHMPGGGSKVERYGWAKAGERGELLWVDKNKILVDHGYQRDAEESKVKAIARDFSWVAFGVGTVARRSDGTLYAVDFQHRLMAALRRSDVTAVPVIVFDMDETSDEARAFYVANSNRRPVSAIAKHKAKVGFGHPAATLAAKLIADHGRHACKSDVANGVKCVGRLEKYAETDPETLAKMWPLLMRLTAGKMLKEHHLCALMYIEQNARHGASITDPRWEKRVLALGPDGIAEAAIDATRYMRAGGERVWARGVVDAINRKLRQKLSISDEPIEPPDAPDGA